MASILVGGTNISQLSPKDQDYPSILDSNGRFPTASQKIKQDMDTVTTSDLRKNSSEPFDIDQNDHDAEYFLNHKETQKLKDTVNQLMVVINDLKHRYKLVQKESHMKDQLLKRLKRVLNSLALISSRQDANDANVEDENNYPNERGDSSQMDSTKAQPNMFDGLLDHLQTFHEDRQRMTQQISVLKGIIIPCQYEP